MANITASLVKELREMTSAGMMDCKKALVETDGDLQAAVEVLREKGLSKAAKKAGRIAAMGLVKTAVSADGKTAAIVEVNSETDFVAKNETFINFVQDLANLALEAESNDIEAFKAMAFQGSTVGEVLTSMIATIGENMSIRRIDKVAGDTISTYIHGGGNIGVIIAASGANNDANHEALKNVAMQVAAMNPQFIKREDMSADELENIGKITKESALNDPFSLPKPILNELLEKVHEVWEAADIDILAEKRADSKFNFNYLPNFLSDDAKTKLAGLAIAAKMEIFENKIFKGLVDGRISKQLKEICLMDQVYVKAEDGKQTVAQYMGTVDKDLALVKVVRYEVGEGIEKKEEDFAAEVAAQLNK